MLNQRSMTGCKHRQAREVTLFPHPTTPLIPTKILLPRVGAHEHVAAERQARGHARCARVQSPARANSYTLNRSTNARCASELMPSCKTAST